MRKPRGWAKHHLSWYTSPSHFGLSAYAHAVGPLLEVLANRSQTWGTIHPIGNKNVVDYVSNLLAFRPHHVRRALSDLESRGTIRINSDGSVTFPNFASWQETPDAERMREMRAAASESSELFEECSADVIDSARARSGSPSISGSDLSEGSAEGRANVASPSAPKNLAIGDEPPWNIDDLVDDWNAIKLPTQKATLAAGGELREIVDAAKPREYWRTLFRRAASSNLTWLQNASLYHVVKKRKDIDNGVFDKHEAAKKPEPRAPKMQVFEQNKKPKP